MSKLTLSISNETGEPVNNELFERKFEIFKGILSGQIEEKLGNQKGRIDLLIVGDSAIQKINHDYRGKDMPTDVISCAYLEGVKMVSGEEEVAVGDMFISVETAERQAVEKGHNLETEMEILFVHGLLHLFGFDHNTDKEEAEMESWAKKILAQ